MRPRDQRRIVDLVWQQRMRLEALRAGFDGREGEQIDRAMWRMWEVEDSFQSDLRKWHRRPHVLASRVRDRLEELRRIGAFAQTQPTQLQLPVRYWRADLPDPVPSISIVTPSYGQGRYIERTIFSVIGQQYPRLEYVVQDGGSRDETLDVLRHHGPEITSWESTPDDGMGEALNTGFSRTSGDIMAYINTDDLLLPGSLAYVARYFAAHPEVDVIYGDRVLIDSHGRKIGMWVLPRHHDDALILRNFVPQETLFWRRRIWDAVGGRFDTTFKFAVEWDLMLRFREQGAKFAHVPRLLGAFRVHSAQKTQRQEALGDQESNRLRRRLHGRHVSTEEADTRVTSYRRRHVRAHFRQRLLDRLALAHREVRMVPPNAWVRTPQGQAREAVTTSKPTRQSKAASER
ncbi:MAG TPA: glycosyltransferase family 2 protein [Solirubrobacteraceae bacterium]